MNTRVIISIVFVGLGLIIAAIPQNKTLPYKLTASQLLEETQTKVQFFTPDEVADLIIQKDPSIQLIDVRGQDEFEKYSLPNALNIPLNDLLSEEWRSIIDQDVKMNIFYSNGTVLANQAWMITRQLGFNNNYVLQGGLNYWAETILNPEKPSSTSPDEEIAKYNFRKGAAKALGGDVESTNTVETNVSVSKPIIKKSPKRKRVAGGC